MGTETRSQIQRPQGWCRELRNLWKTLTVGSCAGIYVNGRPYTITMHTPGDEEALARGLLLSEQVYTEKRIDIQNHRGE